jgi:hypothetical protein
MSTPRFLIALALVATLGAASAQPLPPASAERSALFNLGARVDLAGFGTLPLSDPRFGAIFVGVAGDPALSASSDIGPNTTASVFGRGSALLSYQLMVVGPQGQVPVLLDVRGSAAGSATVGASIAVESFWSIFFDVNNPLAGDDVRSGQIFGGGFEQSFGRTVELTLVANLPYTISMLADAQAAATDTGSRASASAFVDPVVSLGAGVDPALYSLAFSAGILNTAPVPEPASALALLLGLLLLGGRRSLLSRSGSAGLLRSPRGTAGSAGLGALSSRSGFAGQLEPRGGRAGRSPALGALRRNAPPPAAAGR